MKKQLIKTSLIALGFLIQTQCIVNKALAQVSINPDFKPPYSPEFKDKVLSQGNSYNYINFILQVFAGGLIFIAGPIAVLMIVWGGSSYISSRGDQGATDKAKKTITYAIIGLIVIILSYSIVSNVIAAIASVQ